MSQTAVIPAKYCGPPKSGNGGYVSGVLAEALGGGVVETTLRAPPPLDQPLELSFAGDGVVMRDGEREIASARRAEIGFKPPGAPSYEETLRATTRFSEYAEHIFETCFVCGPAREAGDGMRLFAGPDDEDDMVAAPWTPDASVVIDGEVPERMVWAALDCPGYFALRQPGLPAVLGRMTAEVRRTPRAGERCIVGGWLIERGERKQRAGTAVFGADGEMLARAETVWIRINKAAFS